MCRAGKPVPTVQVVTDEGRVFPLLLLLHGQIHEALAEGSQGIGELYRGHKLQEVRPQHLEGRARHCRSLLVRGTHGEPGRGTQSAGSGGRGTGNTRAKPPVMGGKTCIPLATALLEAGREASAQLQQHQYQHCCLAPALEELAGHPLQAQLSGGSLCTQISALHPEGRGRWQQLLQRYGAVTAHPGRQSGHPVRHTGRAGQHGALHRPPQSRRRLRRLTLFIRSTVVLSRKSVLTLMLWTLSLVKSSASGVCFFGCWESGEVHGCHSE